MYDLKNKKGIDMLRQTSLTLDYEDIVKLRAKGVNVSQICRSAIKNHISVEEGTKNNMDVVSVLTKEKIELLNELETLTRERDELKKKVNTLEMRARAKMRIVYNRDESA